MIKYIRNLFKKKETSKNESQPRVETHIDANGNIRRTYFIPVTGLPIGKNAKKHIADMIDGYKTEINWNHDSGEIKFVDKLEEPVSKDIWMPFYDDVVSAIPSDMLGNLKFEPNMTADGKIISYDAVPKNQSDHESKIK